MVSNLVLFSHTLKYAYKFGFGHLFCLCLFEEKILNARKLVLKMILEFIYLLRIISFDGSTEGCYT